MNGILFIVFLFLAYNLQFFYNVKNKNVANVLFYISNYLINKIQYSKFYLIKTFLIHGKNNKNHFSQFLHIYYLRGCNK